MSKPCLIFHTGTHNIVITSDVNTWFRSLCSWVLSSCL